MFVIAISSTSSLALLIPRSHLLADSFIKQTPSMSCSCFLGTWFEDELTFAQSPICYHLE